MTNVADGETDGGGPALPAHRRLGELKPKPFQGRPQKLALVQQLRTLVVATGRTSKYIAAQLNISPPTLSKFLSGVRLPDRTEVERIAQVCGVTDEVRAQLLRVHTAAIGEAHPHFAGRLAKADAYEETVLLHQHLQTRLEAITAEHRQLQAGYDALMVRHESTGQALTAAEDQIRDQERQHQEALSRLTARLQDEQHSRQSDRIQLQGQLLQARGARDEQLRRNQEEKARLREEMRRQGTKLEATLRELQESAGEMKAARQERDQARLEVAELREELVGLRVDLAAAETEQERRDHEDAVLAQALQTVENVLEQHPDTSPEHVLTEIAHATAATSAGTSETALQAAGHPRVAEDATHPPGPGESRETPVSEEPAPKPTGSNALWYLAATGTLVVGLTLFIIGLFHHTPGPFATAHLTATGGWFAGSGFLLVFGSGPLFMRAMEEDGIDPGDYPVVTM
ncbi:helix-turn-helix domain-containing protein [Streptomyces sp. NPDC006208]|uniref:helix-turn-helix domain-containing protein n=1 Tax=Streptomyces sp. NPDC006208 TaxID=3156734 RepID=UPI0033AA4AD4